MTTEGGIFAFPPVNGWEKDLSEWHDYYSEPPSWPLVVWFVGELPDRLFAYQYAGTVYFNRQSSSLFSERSREELLQIGRALAKVADARERSQPANLGTEEANSLERLRATVGNQSIGSLRGEFQLDEVLAR